MANTSSPEQKQWHTLTCGEALEALGSSLDGLTRVEAGRRLLYFGPNELEERKRIAPWKIFLEQFKSFLIVILLVAVALSAVLGEVVESVRNRGPGL